MPKGFAPLYDDNSKILVLGSFPSVKSRQTDFYYGNKQNRFWKTLQTLYGGEIDTVEHKKQLCLTNGIALWDIVAECDIVGSADASITNITFADINKLLKKHTRVQNFVQRTNGIQVDHAGLRRRFARNLSAVDKPCQPEI